MLSCVKPSLNHERKESSIKKIITYEKVIHRHFINFNFLFNCKRPAC